MNNKKGSDKDVAKIENTMTEEVFNELIDNFEVVSHLTEFGRKGIKQNVKKLQKRIQELEECKIVQDKNIRGGKPVIEETRLTVIDVLLFMTEFIKKHEKEFRENYADVNSKQIVSSINYLLENSIPKEKAKDVLQNNRNELFCITYVSEKQYEPYKKQIDRINKIEKELLEGEK